MCTWTIEVTGTFIPCTNMYGTFQKEQATEFLTTIQTWATSVLAPCASAGSILLAGTGPSRSFTDCFTTGRVGCCTKGWITWNTAPAPKRHSATLTKGCYRGHSVSTQWNYNGIYVSASSLLPCNGFFTWWYKQPLFEIYYVILNICVAWMATTTILHLQLTEVTKQLRFISINYIYSA